MVFGDLFKMDKKIENVANASPGVEAEKENGKLDNVSSSTKPQEQTRRIKFSRGFSAVDPEMVSNLHKDITNMKGKEGDEDRYGCFRDVTLTRFSFTLPNFTNYEEKFVEFLMKELVENSTLKALEESGHLNWWVKNNCFQRLLPLATSGDGNCLLHAASLGIWGVHDRLLNLRQAVHHTLTSTLAERTIKRRWRWYQWIKNRDDKLVFSEEEWEKEWQLMLSLASPKPRSLLTKSPLVTVPEVVNDDDKDGEGNITPISKPRKFSTSSDPHYESLEEVHVFALAHALQRPIIVVSDTVMKDYEGNAICPIPFGGVYLPVECDPEECCRIPLVLAYSCSHFSPVVAMELQTNEETSTVQVVPLVDKYLNPLALPFSADPGNDWDCLKHENGDIIKEKSLTSDGRMLLLKKYLDVVFVNVNLLPHVQQCKETPREETSSSGSSDVSGPKADDFVVEQSVAVVELPCGKQPSYYKKLIEVYIEKAKQRFAFEHEMQESLPQEGMSSTECASDGCDLYGTVANNYLCTKCFQVQSNSAKDFKPDDKTGKWELVDHPPPYDPPPYEVIGTNRVYYPPSFTGTCPKSSEKISETSLAMISVQCQTGGCIFYGTADKNGFCSKCYNEHRQYNK